MNLVDDGKLQSAGDEIVDRSKASFSALLVQFHDAMDGWTLTINVPAFALFGWSKLTLAIPEITIRLNKPKGQK